MIRKLIPQQRSKAQKIYIAIAVGDTSRYNTSNITRPFKDTFFSTINEYLIKHNGYALAESTLLSNL